MESTSISSLGCHSVTALEIARTFKEQLIKTVKEQKFIPKMVAFLANEGKKRLLVADLERSVCSSIRQMDRKVL